jgi:exopolyphosphatase/guanosine-5'-triphosphate,3'-diphosphate pyrophosphatase
MIIVRLNPNNSYSILRQEKEVVRLGENEFTDQTLRREAMDRAILVCRKFADLSKVYSADEITAVATSAVREATNQVAFVERLRQEVGIDIGVISGLEEARLVYLGVSSGVELWDRTALFIDIGGGSTELIVGDTGSYSYLDSLKLGAIRLTNMFIPDGYDGPIDPKVYAKMRNHVSGSIIHSVQSIKKHQIDLTLGSSGTIMNLAEIAARIYGDGNGSEKQFTLKLTQLNKLITMLCSLPLNDRRQVPGINPERADIIIGGAAILETIMEELELNELVVSDRGVQNGLMVDYLSRIEGNPHAQGMSVREISILQLGRSCNIDEGHAETVVRLASQLFDSSRTSGLHSYGSKERELLLYSAYLHDIGDFISFTNHHLHSYYILKNNEMLGFDEREIAIMANLARYHRKRVPKRNDPEMVDIELKTQEKIIVLASLLRLAESLDRSHASLVRSAKLSSNGKDRAVLTVVSNGDAHLELWGVEDDIKAFRKAFHRQLAVEALMESS